MVWSRSRERALLLPHAEVSHSTHHLASVLARTLYGIVPTRMISIGQAPCKNVWHGIAIGRSGDTGRACLKGKGLPSVQIPWCFRTRGTWGIGQDCVAYCKSFCSFQGQRLFVGISIVCTLPKTVHMQCMHKVEMSVVLTSADRT